MGAQGTYPWAAGYYDDGDRPQIVTSRFQYDDSHTLDRYHATGGYQGLRKALDDDTRRRRRRGQEVDLARPWRCRLPGRRQVGVHPGRCVAALPRRQRRRERAGHLQGPPADGARSAPAHRGQPDRLLRGRSVAVLPLRPRRDGRSPTSASPKRSTTPTPPATSARTSSAPSSASTSCCTGAPAPTWSARRRR